MMIDAHELQDLEDEIPLLIKLRAFVLSMGEIGWFANIGETLSSECLHIARAYVSQLGFPETEIVPLQNWQEAADAAAAQDFNSPAWEAEEQLRASLTTQAMDIFTPQALEMMTAFTSASLAELVQESAEEVLYMSDEDDALLHLLIGAAQQAAHSVMLAFAAHLDPYEQNIINKEELMAHPFMLKYQLFADGRWPVAITGRSFNIL